MFDNIRKYDPEALLKIQPLNGDCTEKKLGLSRGDQELVQAEVNIFVHTAASVRFDDPLQKAVILNTRGAQEVCQLALAMPNLKVSPTRNIIGYSLQIYFRFRRQRSWVMGHGSWV